MGVFDKRVNVKPYEYPEWLQFKEAINGTMWVFKQFNYESSINDYFNYDEQTREVIKRSLLAISQIEVAVKRFWADLYKFIPKPEGDDVGVTFGESEVRHKDAYLHLLELLGVDDEFADIFNIPAIIDRVNYLTGIQEKKYESKEQFVTTLLLFSVFVEHISLFSQFLVIMSFNKYDNTLKGISNVIEATSKEEEIHGLFGYEVIKTIKKEYPEMFTEEFYENIKQFSIKAQKAENKIVDWIFEKGDVQGIVSKDVVKNYINSRFNNSMEILEVDLAFDVDQELLAKTEWFDLEVIGTKSHDFFDKHNINYNKNSKSFDKDSLF